MNRTEKQTCIDELSAEFRAIKNAILIDYRGLKVVDVTELRREITKLSSKYVVVKNTLAERALESQGITVLSEHLKGPIGLVLSREPLAAAKVLTEFAREHQKPGIRAGLVDGAAVSQAHIQRLGTIPDRQTLLAMIAGTMNNILASFAGCLEALREQRGAASNA